MATSSQIAGAAQFDRDRKKAAAKRREQRKRSANYVEAPHLLGGPVPETDAEELAAAALMVRRLANRHGCVGIGCTDPRHADDVRSVGQVWELLGVGR